MSEKLLTVKEIAEVLSVNTETIYREVKKPISTIPFKKIGSSYRFLLSDVLLATGNKQNETPKRP